VGKIALVLIGGRRTLASRKPAQRCCSPMGGSLVWRRERFGRFPDQLSHGFAFGNRLAREAATLERILVSCRRSRPVRAAMHPAASFAVRRRRAGTPHRCGSSPRIAGWSSSDRYCGDDRLTSATPNETATCLGPSPSLALRSEAWPRLIDRAGRRADDFRQVAPRPLTALH
jgi:hypothetical protein